MAGENPSRPSTLERIKEMRQQGHEDPNIITTLQQEGISPRNINDALAQSKIKAAISDPPPQGNNMENIQGMQPSIMQSNPAQQPSMNPLPQEGPYAQEIQVPQPQAYQPQQEQGYYSEAYPESYGPPEYTEEGYGEGFGQEQYPQQPSSSSETITEIASQIISEKMKKANRSINELIEIKSLLTNKVEKIDSRLERIENIIDKLQTALLRKASEQEQNISDIKNEMGEMQVGFSKILNPLFDIERSLEKPKRATRKRRTTKKK